MIDQATIERVIETADIVDVVGDFVALKRRGSGYTACCPFHNEKTPSFHVTPRLGIYKCFGCGKGGNAVSFVMDHEHMTFVEAIKYLGNKYGIEVREKEESAEEIASRQKRESLLIVNDYAQKYYTNALLNSNEGKAVGLSYFRERKFSDKTIRDFLLGYADRERDSFSRAAVAAGYKKEFLLELGLSVPKRIPQNTDRSGRESPADIFAAVPDKADADYATAELNDRVCERVIFPIRGISGQVVAFGARKLRGDKNIPKYINSPENLVYVKNRTLYGLYEAKSSIAQKQNCYLVEGYTDVLSLHQSGIINVVASCGTSLTAGQIQLIKRFSPKVTIIYDGDAAGIHASLRGIDMFLAEGLNVKVALFPDGEDPDSYARSHTPEELEKFLEEAEEDFIYYQLRTLSEGVGNDPFKLSRIVNEMAQSISLIPDGITRSVYSNETAKKMNIPAESIIEKVAELRSKRARDEHFRRTRAEEIERERKAAVAYLPQEGSGTQGGFRPGQHSASDNIGSNTGDKIGSNTGVSASQSGQYASSNGTARPVPALIKANEELVSAERDIIYYLLKFGGRILKDMNNALYGVERTEEGSVAEFIRSNMEEDGLEMSDKSLRSIYEEYFTLEDVSDSESVLRHFARSADQGVSASVIDIFTSKYRLRSEKVRESLTDEAVILPQLVPKAMFIYKSKVVAVQIEECREALKTVGPNAGKEEEERLIVSIQNLTRIKHELLRLANRKI